MWCRVCEIETTETTCSVCGYPTINDNLGSVDNTVVHYCKSCSTPIIFRLNDLTWDDLSDEELEEGYSLIEEEGEGIPIKDTTKVD